MKPTPPHWADRFLGWYCREDLVEEIRGDAYELFYRKAKTSLRAARAQFVWNVMRFFRLKNIRKSKSPETSNAIPMLRSYLLIGFRNIVRNGATSLINIFGLAVGVAGAVTIFIFADQFFHTDDFHKNRERIYQITNMVNQDLKSVNLGTVPFLLAPAMKEDISAVENITRVELGRGAVRQGDKVFSERLYFVDNTFFDIFTYPFLDGNENALKSKNNIVFTKMMAEKYFGDKPAVGQTVSVKFSNDKSLEFTVGAVVDQPLNNTLYFNFLLPMEVFTDLKLKDEYRWNDLTNATFVLLKPQHAIAEVSGLMGKYKKLQNASSPEWIVEDFRFYPLKSLASRSYEIEENIMGSGHPQGVYAMGVIAFLLLLLACFNYMNISLATITNRLKEIGIRKVIGGRKKEIVVQFITENFLLSVFSIGTGFLVSFAFFMPGLISIVGYQIPFAFSSPATFILFFTLLLTFIVTVSGVYPASYVSNFQPIAILKGKEKFGQRSKFSRILLTAQFMLAFMTMVGCFVFIDNAIYLRHKDWGYAHEQNIVVPLNNEQQYLKLRDFSATNKNILSFAGSVDHIGYSNPRSTVVKAGQRYEIVTYKVGFNYLETMNLRLIKGRLFDKKIESDKGESIIVNENFVKIMGWTDPIDQIFEYNNAKRRVIGVVENFHYDNFYRPILPVLLSIAEESDFRFLSIKVLAGEVPETVAELKEAWTKIAPDDPYEGIPQDEVFANFRRNNKTEINLLGFVAIMTLILACLGLFGLVSYNITRRMKEFSVRKVFGADSGQIFLLMNQDYIWILLIAFVLGAPAGLFLMDNLIKHIYADPQSAGVLPFVIAISLMATTVALTVGLQMKRIVSENPATTLRNE